MYSSVIFHPHFFVRARESNQNIFLSKHLPTVVSVQWCPASPPPPTSNCPPMSSYTLLQLSTCVQLCPPPTVHWTVSRSTYVQLCPPPTVHYRCPRFLPPAPPADVVAIMKGCLQDIYVLYIYMSQLDYRRISPTTVHTTIPHT